MKSHAHTVSIDMLMILQHYLGQLGEQEVAFSRDLANTIQGLASENDRVPIMLFADQWGKALTSTQDKNFGLHFGQSASVTRSSGILFPVMMNCPTLHSALEKQARYHNLVTDFIQLHLEENGKETILTWETADNSIALDRHLVESIFCSLTLTLNEIARGAMQINEIHFMHATPQEIREHKQVFQCPLKFRQPRHAIYFDANSLAQPLMLANPQLLERLEQVAREMQAQQSTIHRWTNQVCTTIRHTLTQGEKPQLATVSADLHISARQLQNKLNAENTSYQEVLDETRKSMALDYLQKPQMSVCEIAFLLGFSEQSTFNHAFKRWTGESPGIYRKNL